MKCDICHKPIMGVYYFDKWGNAVHPTHHGRETERCYCCGRFTDDTNRNKALIYGDGRLICRFCHDNAVNNAQRGLESKNKAFALFRKAGLPLPEERIKLVINDKKYAAQNLSRNSFHGLMKAKWTGSFVGAKCEYTVHVISGLHYVVFNSVLAHELMHVYITENKIKLSRTEEEGLCELVSYFMLELSTDKIAGITKQNIIDNPDPVYGDGFRMMKNRIDKAGSWNKLMMELKQIKT